MIHFSDDIYRVLKDYIISYVAHRYSIPTKEVAILILHTVHRGVKIYILKADTCISPKRHVNPNIMSSSCAKKILSFLENG